MSISHQKPCLPHVPHEQTPSASAPLIQAASPALTQAASAPLIQTASPALTQAASPAFGELLERPLPERHRSTADIVGVVLGRVAAVDASGVLVTLPQSQKAVRAHSLCPLVVADVGRVCAVLFMDGDVSRPLVVGCIVDGVMNDVETAMPEAVPAVEPDEEPYKHVLRVDGERVVIEANKELELRCGESVILLQHNGVIEIRGNYVTSQATATQRIRGGSVHVN